MLEFVETIVIRDVDVTRPEILRFSDVFGNDSESDSLVDCLRSHCERSQNQNGLFSVFANLPGPFQLLKRFAKAARLEHCAAPKSNGTRHDQLLPVEKLTIERFRLESANRNLADFV